MLFKIIQKSFFIDYILPEVFKNAVRATIENHPDSSEFQLPSIHVTIANNEVDFILRYYKTQQFLLAKS